MSKVGRSEVIHQLETHHAGGPDGNVGVGREITINLDCKEKRGQQQRQSVMLIGMPECRVEEQYEPVGNDAFLEKAKSHLHQT